MKKDICTKCKMCKKIIIIPNNQSVVVCVDNNDINSLQVVSQSIPDEIITKFYNSLTLQFWNCVIPGKNCPFYTQHFIFSL